MTLVSWAIFLLILWCRSGKRFWFVAAAMVANGGVSAPPIGAQPQPPPPPKPSKRTNGPLFTDFLRCNLRFKIPYGIPNFLFFPS